MSKVAKVQEVTEQYVLFTCGEDIYDVGAAPYVFNSLPTCDVHSIPYYKSPTGKSERTFTIPIDDYLLVQERMKAYGATIEINSNQRGVIKNYLRWRKNQLHIKSDNRSEEYVREFDILKLPLYDFQTVGAKFLYNAKRAILGDKVGIGKTPQSLAFSERLLAERKVDLVIVVTPASLKSNWADDDRGGEIRKFTDSTFAIIQGLPAKRAALYEGIADYNYVVINYELLIRDYEKLIIPIQEQALDVCLIVDELQYCKNWNAKRTQATFQLSKHAEYFAGLTATPLENNVFELFSIMKPVNEFLFGKNFNRFARKFAVTDFFGRPVGAQNTKLLTSKIRPYIIRRKKEDVIEQLPNIIMNNYWVELDKVESKLYKDISGKIVDMAEDAISNQERFDKVRNANALAYIMYARQCVLSPYLVGYKQKTSTKAKDFISFLEELDSDDKVVAFSFFASYIELLQPMLDKAGIDNMCINGNPKSKLHVKVKDRARVVNKFDESKIYKVLVSSDILREGINIPSANYLVNLDLLFNPGRIEQRFGRIDRITQENDVLNFINFIAKGTIEEYMYETMIERLGLSDMIIDEGKKEKRITNMDITKGTQKLSPQFLRDLFTKYQGK